MTGWEWWLGHCWVVGWPGVERLHGDGQTGD